MAQQGGLWQNVSNQMMPPWRMAGQQQQISRPHKQSQETQQQKQHRIDELLGVLQRPTVTLAQVDAAQQELVHLFSNNTNLANTPTPIRVQALVSVLSRNSPAAAGAAVSILNVLSKSYPTITSHFLQQASALSALARLLQGTCPAAQTAALQLLLAAVGQSTDEHFEAPVSSTVHLQHTMSPWYLSGLVHQLAQGGDSTAAAAVVLACWTVTCGSAASAMSVQLATLCTKTRAALHNTANLLLHRGMNVCLADAAAQLLHTIAEAGPQAAQMVASTQLIVARLVGLVVTSSQQRPTATPQEQALTKAATWRAAGALSTILQKADARVRWQLASHVGVVAQLVQALKQTEDAALQDRALQVLSAAACNKEECICNLMIAQPAFAHALLRLLPGGARPVQAAHELATLIAASSSSNASAQFMRDLVSDLASLHCQADAPAQPQQAAAAEQIVWVLTQLAPARMDRRQQSKGTVTFLVPTSSNSPVAGKLRGSVAIKLAAHAAQDSGRCMTASQQAAGVALWLLIVGASPEERTRLARTEGIASSLAHCLEQHRSCSSCDSGTHSVLVPADAARALIQLAATSEMQLHVCTTVTADGVTSMHGWLADNSSALECMAASSWGSLSVAELAAAAKIARQAHAKEQEQQPGAPPPPLLSVSLNPPPSPPPPPPSSTPPRSMAAPPPATEALQQSRHQVAAATRKAPAARQPTDINRRSADQGGPTAAAAAAARLLAGHALFPSQTPHSPAFEALSSATQKLILDECGAIPPDQHLPSWQVAAQPFDPQQLQALCATYMRRNFAGESWEPQVRSQELVPMLEQLHTQAKAEQQAPPQARPAAAAAAAVHPTPASVKLLRALRLLQHWDIVCPSQPGMPQPLRQMMQQAGCAAAGSACDSDDDDDDVQVVDIELAAEVDDDVEAQLQQLEDGDRDMVLVKYVPGRHGQPDVQLLDQPPPALQQEAPAVPPAAPVQRPGQQQQEPDQAALQPAAQPVVEEELPLRMRTRAAKRGRHG